MSHFSTLVVVQAGSSAEALAKMEAMLEPFSENLEVPHDVFGDTPTSVLDEALWWRGSTSGRLTPEQIASFEAEIGPEPSKDEREGHAWRAWASKVITDYHGGNAIFDGDRIGYTSTYNPNSKWDYYRLGGRWNGFFPLKPGALPDATLTPRPWEFEHEGITVDPNSADLAQKRDIDWASKALDKELDAEARYSEFERIVAPLSADAIAGYRTWAEISAEHEPNWDVARATYGNQPVVQALRSATRAKDSVLGWDTSYEDFHVGDGGRERYVAEAKAGAFATFAVLDSEGWHARGEMGWFGMAHDEKDRQTWVESFGQMLDNLDDDTWLGVFDLHI